VATAQVTAVWSVPLPAHGSIFTVFTGPSQTYIREIQKELVPRVIAYSGFRWQNSLCRPEMLQILQFITICKGGVYVHWDSLAVRSGKGTDVKALGGKVAASHAHATRMHKMYVRETVAKLFRASSNDNKLCFVKKEVFGIADGGPIIGPDHPAMLEMFALPITDVLCCSKVKIEPTLKLTAARGWQAITKPRFCSSKRILKRLQKLLCSRTGCIRASKSSSISSVRTFACHFDAIIVTSGWNSALFVTSGRNPAL
jgi:hypothetical protein